ncbi:3-deoxy-D-manno-octulosonic-acid transferase [Pseudooceanicola antarcticus]|uniref:3-deoxy-D-manno-octulosonic acid transferase n=1 Tax=Pseudooceanicola antarcticus TaxID=1247613 RepID=A0A285J3S2_9RHOB|nr:3-deoxy-D-manno-octulosonic acid transferase [Pseudooceanicola antarcticus]PJE29760.1 3-deoxy-D-manno-octulosonic acid transferase [Pseudooceanicola antarcticus]SNY54507.1 3-deoxy-D-manno-octulosonic-acid transferase [Pseudooceanicola antarcticus]
MTNRRGSTPFYRLYCGLAAAASPLAWRRVRAKLQAEGIAPDRMAERMGRATLARPEGQLFWFHAASVGESVSALALIEKVLELNPGAHALVTTGTAGSAQVLAKRLPERALHQFAPLDTARALRRFFRHWRPDAGIFVESELWPQMIVRARATGMRLALVNARLSKSSLRNWRRFGTTFRFLLDQFCLIRTQDEATLEALLELGADRSRVARGPNLKSMISPPPAPAQVLAELAPQFNKLFWAAAATHPGEEDAVIEAHLAAREALGRPDLQLLLIPRHPHRAAEIAAMIRDRGLSVSQRSRGQAPGGDVYLADTLGEMGLWYSLSPLAFLGGSLVPVGGHTPYEPACFGTPILHGPHYENFAEVYAAFDQSGAARQIEDAAELGREVARLLADGTELARMSEIARGLADGRGARITHVAEELLQALSSTAPAADAGPLR